MSSEDCLDTLWHGHPERDFGDENTDPREGGNGMIEMSVGKPVWVSCEVKPGPFDDERLVRVRLNGSTWVGFVPSLHLADPSVESGETQVKARILDVDRGTFTAKVLGHSISSQPLHGSLDEVVPVDSLQAGNPPLS